MTTNSNTNGRTARGTFAKGNPGGPGRPRRAVERAYLEAAAGAVSLDDWQAIIARAVEDAKAGDAKARTWVASLLVGPLDESADGRLETLDELAELKARTERENARHRAMFGEDFADLLA